MVIGRAIIVGRMLRGRGKEMREDVADVLRAAGAISDGISVHQQLE